VKIYTRRGDTGETDLFGGARVAKDHERVEAVGAVDELNASLGVCAAATPHDDQRAALRGVQRRLFDLGAYLASPAKQRGGKPTVGGPGAVEVEELERTIDGLETELEPLTHFILPGGTPASAALHFARTVCRRAERRTLTLHRAEPLDAGALRYLNRLSDLLFVMARVENRRAGEPDVEWESQNR